MPSSDDAPLPEIVGASPTMRDVYRLTPREFGYVLSTFPLVEAQSRQRVLERFTTEARRTQR